MRPVLLGVMVCLAAFGAVMLVRTVTGRCPDRDVRQLVLYHWLLVGWCVLTFGSLRTAWHYRPRRHRRGARA